MGQSSSTAEVEKEPAGLPVPARPAQRAGLFRRFWQWQFAGPLRRVDQDSRAFLACEGSQRADRKVVIILVTVAVALTIQRYAPLGAWVSGTVRFVAGLGADALVPLSTRIEQFASTAP